MSADGHSTIGPTQLGQTLVADEDRGSIALAVQKTSGAALTTDGKYSPLQVDSSGNLRVTGSFNSASVGSTGSAVPSSADYIGINVAGTLRGATGVNPTGTVYALQVDLASIAGTTVVTGSGTATGALRVELPTNGTGVIATVGAVTAITNALPAGTNNIGDVDIASIAAGDNNIGNVDIVTVPAPLSTTGGGTEATALRVTVANDSTGVLSVDDNGGALTVDGTVAVSSVGGTVAVTQSGTWDEVGINDSGNSITVDNAQLSVVGGGTEATAMRVTIANDSTGLISVDDNGGALTVDNGGTFAVQDSAAEASLSVLDDWDESDRAKVNPIVGQAGVAGGTGVDGATVQRVSLATNVALPAGTNAIGKLAANSGVDIGDVDITSIAAGDNNIGNVDIASIAAGDNNIGNVDIVSGVITTVTTLTNLPASIQGPGLVVIDSYGQVAINLTTGADQVLVASAASKQIWVYGYTFTCGDADGQTVSFQDQDDTALSGIMEFFRYGGAAVSPSGNFAMPIWKLATDKDLEIDITGGDVDGWLSYAIVSV